MIAEEGNDERSCGFVGGVMYRVPADTMEVQLTPGEMYRVGDESPIHQIHTDEAGSPWISHARERFHIV
jgi:hypothetical protein